MICRPDGWSENSRYCVMPGRDDGWDVVVERAPGIVSSTYCSDWHRVERVCAALERQMREIPSGATSIESAGSAMSAMHVADDQ
jgi:hypothetical protein